MINASYPAIDTSPDLRRLLTELMLAACTTNRVAQARQIQDGYKVIAPNAPEVAIAGSLIELTVGNADAAIAQLQPLAKAGDSYGLVFLALALKVAGRGAASQAMLASLPADGNVGTEALVAALRDAG